MEATAFSADDVRRLATKFPLTLVRAADNAKVGAINAMSLDAALGALFVNGNTRVSIVYRH